MPPHAPATLYLFGLWGSQVIDPQRDSACGRHMGSWSGRPPRAARSSTGSARERPAPSIRCGRPSGDTTDDQRSGLRALEARRQSRAAAAGTGTEVQGKRPRGGSPTPPPTQYVCARRGSGQLHGGIARFLHWSLQSSQHSPRAHLQTRWTPPRPLQGRPHLGRMCGGSFTLPISTGGSASRPGGCFTASSSSAPSHSRSAAQIQQDTAARIAAARVSPPNSPTSSPLTPWQQGCGTGMQQHGQPSQGRLRRLAAQTCCWQMTPGCGSRRGNSGLSGSASASLPSASSGPPPARPSSAGRPHIARGARSPHLVFLQEGSPGRLATCHRQHSAQWTPCRTHSQSSAGAHSTQCRCPLDALLHHTSYPACLGLKQGKPG